MYRKMNNGTCWPVPCEDFGEVIWRMVHATPTESDKAYAASVMNAYSQIIFSTQAERNDVIKQLRLGKNLPKRVKP